MQSRVSELQTLMISVTCRTRGMERGGRIGNIRFEDKSRALRAKEAKGKRWVFRAGKGS